MNQKTYGALIAAAGMAFGVVTTDIACTSCTAKEAKVAQTVIVDALTDVQIACIGAQEALTENTPEAIAKICEIDDTLLPIVKKIFGANAMAKQMVAAELARRASPKTDSGKK